MKYRDHISQTISSARKVEKEAWERCQRHSERYMKVLGIKEDDLGVLFRYQDSDPCTGTKPILSIEVNDEEFAFIVIEAEPVDGIGKDLTKIVCCVCQENPFLNKTLFSDLMDLTSISDEWHEKVYDILENQEYVLKSDVVGFSQAIPDQEV